DLDVRREYGNRPDLLGSLFDLRVGPVGSPVRLHCWRHGAAERDGRHEQRNDENALMDDHVWPPQGRIALGGTEPRQDACRAGWKRKTKKLRGTYAESAAPMAPDSVTSLVGVVPEGQVHDRRRMASTICGSVAKSCSVRASAASITSRAA